MSAYESPFSRNELKELRQRFPHTRDGRTYLNHAAISPLSNAVIDAIRRRLKQRNSGNIDVFERDAATAEMARKYLSNMINASTADRLAYVGNTSEGLNIIAGGLHWKSGDHILIGDQEFPANVYPYSRLRKQNVEVEKIPSDHGRITPEKIRDHIREETRLFAISAVQFLSGYRADLESIGAICKEHDCWLVVDGIQALGVVPVDVQKCNIDGFVAGSHKWLMGPQGIGFMYVSKKLQEAIVDHPVGWLSVQEPWLLFETDQQLDETARRYELGTPNSNGLRGLHATLETYHQVGPARIRKQIRSLTTRLLEDIKEWKDVSLITPDPWNHRAGIVTLSLPNTVDQQSLMETLQRQHVTLALREDSLRFSPHYYNTTEEIDLALNAVKKALSE